MQASLNKDAYIKYISTTIVVLPNGAQWQNLELKFCRLLQHGNRCTSRDRVSYASLRPTKMFMRACLRTTEAACFRVQKSVSNHQLIVAGFQRFVLYDTHRQPVSVSYKHTKRCVHYVYGVCTQILIGVFYAHGNVNTNACWKIEFLRSSRQW